MIKCGIWGCLPEELSLPPASGASSSSESSTSGHTLWATTSSWAHTASSSIQLLHCSTSTGLGCATAAKSAQSSVLTWSVLGNFWAEAGPPWWQYRAGYVPNPTRSFAFSVLAKDPCLWRYLPNLEQVKCYHHLNQIQEPCDP